MSWAVVCKVFQKRSFDLLTRRSGVPLILFCLILLTLGIFHFGEVLIFWSRSNYIAGLFTDNVAGRSYQYRLCHDLPIDVVYTWVNGSHPELIKQLNELKRSLIRQTKNYSNSSQKICSLPDCIPANGLVVEHDVTEKELISMYSFNDKKPKSHVISATYHLTSCVLFETEEALNMAMSLNLISHERIKSVKRLYYTSDGSSANSHFREGLILTLGLPEISDDAHQMNMLAKFGDSISDFSMDASSGIASFYVHDKSARSRILAEKNFTVSGKMLKFLQGFMLWNLESESGGGLEITANRFRDADELRFSLRSLEKFAPWVRHVFVVTNGQIPSWLDLQNPRVTLITHKDIFSNSSHLPTFSSPAIESHLHEISGLSGHFIYLNDDIFFGGEVWPDDFISEDGTQNVYLTYSVPDCKVGCPGSWIKDGYCDKVCNCSNCDWDGGDCDANSTNARNQFLRPISDQGRFPWNGPIQSLHCNPGCADNWIADKYCDVSCNVIKCGFDAGDCGLENFEAIQHVTLARDRVEYSYLGYSVLRFNLHELVGSFGHLNDGEFEDDPIIRSFSYVNSSRLLTLILKPNHSMTSIKSSLNFTDETDTNFIFNFTISLDTSVEEKMVNNSRTLQSEDIVTQKPTPPQVLNPFPKAEKSESSPSSLNISLNLQNYHLPVSIQQEFDKIQSNYNKGLLTKKGLTAKENKVLREYFKKNDMEWSDSSVMKFLVFKSRIANWSANPIQASKKLNINVVQNERHSNDVLHRDGKSRSFQLNRKTLQHNSLPWEKKAIFDQIQKVDDKIDKGGFEIEPRKGRHLMDAFEDSIRHVNGLYNKVYGYFARKVPAHSAHFFNKKILSEMSDKFSDEFEKTSSSKVRSPEDMQLAFSYYYYLMSEKKTKNLEEIFEDFDFDGSGVLSDRELRVVLTRIHKLPLFLKELQDLESSLINCSNFYNSSKISSDLNSEVYHNERLPQITLDFLSNCLPVNDLLLETFSNQNKYKYKVDFNGNSFVSFNMIRNNGTMVVKQLDEVRKGMKKFVCFNDDLDDSIDPKGADDIRSIIKDFYLTFFPKPSQFELDGGRRNAFQTMAEYYDQRKSKTRIAYFVAFIFIALIFFALFMISRFTRKRFVLKKFHA